MDYPHSIIYPLAGRLADNQNGPGLCEKCGMPESSLDGAWEFCFLAERPAEDRKRHRRAVEAGERIR